MSFGQNNALQRWALPFFTSLVLCACGGDGDSTSTSSATAQNSGLSSSDPRSLSSAPSSSDYPGSDSSIEAPLPSITPVSNNAIQALKTGISAGLQEDDKLTLLQSATQIIQSTRQQQKALIAQLIDDSTAAPLNFTQSSQTVSPLLSTASTPLLVSDNGNKLASISTAHGGRGLGYGQDLLVQLAAPSGINQEQLPLFKRSFTWLATGDAQGSLPASVRVSSRGYDINTVKTLLTRLGSKAEVINCTIDDPANTCWQNIDVFVFGKNTPASSTLTNLVAQYMQAGKGVIYLHSGWSESAGGRQVLQGMGMELGSYAGNFFAPNAGFQITSSQTAALQRQATDLMGSHETLLLALLNGTSTDFTKDSSLINKLDALRTDLLGLEGQGINLFTDTYLQKPYMEAHRRLVLWADLVRAQIDYSKIRRSNSNEFLQTMAADSFSYAVRSKESPPKTFGDWMPTASSSLATSQDWETLDITIGQTSGITAIGRGAVPGKTVEIEIVDAAGASLATRIGYIRTRGNPLSQENYTRPRYPDIHQAQLTAGKTLTYTTAWGGPLFLSYNGAQAGSVVKLRVRGSVKYAHFDFTRNPTTLELDEAVQALQRADFGWQTSKMVGGEIQQTIGYAKSAIGNTAPRTYVVDRLKGMIFDSNHLANGYNNMPLSANLSSLCVSIGWDCTGSVHNAPGVQHFVGWLAACGFLCSGHPSDGSAGIGPGWGWWHELGHNTVMKHMTLLTEDGGGCPVECDNNILANASALRQYAITNGAENNNGDRLDHRKLYQDIQAARAAGHSADALQADMFQRFWTKDRKSDSAMRAVHFQLAFIYTKERLGQTQPQPLDVVDFIGMLGRGERLIKSQTTFSTYKNALGMNEYSDSNITNHEMLYVLSSMIIGKDMSQIFAHYGIPVGSTALNSVKSHNLPTLAPEFYAMVPNQANQLERGKWLDLSSSVPTYPF